MKNITKEDVYNILLVVFLGVIGDYVVYIWGYVPASSSTRFPGLVALILTPFGSMLLQLILIIVWKIKDYKISIFKYISLTIAIIIGLFILSLSINKVFGQATIQSVVLSLYWSAPTISLIILYVKSLPYKGNLDV